MEFNTDACKSESATIVILDDQFPAHQSATPSLRDQGSTDRASHLPSLSEEDIHLTQMVGNYPRIKNYRESRFERISKPKNHNKPTRSIAEVGEQPARRCDKQFIGEKTVENYGPGSCLICTPKAVIQPRSCLSSRRSTPDKRTLFRSIWDRLATHYQYCGDREAAYASLSS
jgi:hypothetical protein